ncbi:hypothetical protein AGOR_G00251950 [Albula goreensis]|uniref:Uncharacterized protein n=1 Tax=Albula goreensis TaxID=1534307 RepID=A0A8T3CIM5_9TELE|nr:hypothetical protein AGOR_G00251950 [Albula goreensis]
MDERAGNGRIKSWVLNELDPARRQIYHKLNGRPPLASLDWLLSDRLWTLKTGSRRHGHPEQTPPPVGLHVAHGNALPGRPIKAWGQGLKLAGAAAAGALGGAALGYGLGSLGRPRYGYGYGYGYDDDSSEEDRRFYYAGGPGYRNQSDWRYYRGASTPGRLPSMPLVLGAVVSVILGNWIRGI